MPKKIPSIRFYSGKLHIKSTGEEKYEIMKYMPQSGKPRLLSHQPIFNESPFHIFFSLFVKKQSWGAENCHLVLAASWNAVFKNTTILLFMSDMKLQFGMFSYLYILMLSDKQWWFANNGIWNSIYFDYLQHAQRAIDLQTHTEMTLKYCDCLYVLPICFNMGT